jgi:threonine aldolase
MSHIDCVDIDLDAVETNIVIFKLRGELSAAELVARLKARGVLMSTVGPNAIRAVTHHDVSRGDCLAAIEALSAEVEVTA